MATVTSAPPTRQATPPAKRPRKGPFTWVREHIIAIVAALVDGVTTRCCCSWRASACGQARSLP